MNGTDAPILRAEALSKSYGSWTALQELSFELRPGRVMGFLGPNGAGKTTSIRILTTILAPTSGRFTIDGIGSERPAEIRPRIGVLPETLGLPNQITGLEYLTYFGRLYGRNRTSARGHASALLELVGLRDRARRLIRTYSHGMRQRLGIARALVNDPAVLFLDEPIIGLDPRGQQDLLVLVRRIADERGAGIVFCTHSLTDAEGACDDVVILSSGHVVANGSVGDVLTEARRRMPDRRTLLRVTIPTSSMATATSALGSIAGVGDVTGGVGGHLEVALRPPPAGSPRDDATNRILERLIEADVKVLGFEVEGARLWDAFVELTEGGDA